MTAEYAVALPVMVSVWVMCLFTIVALMAQVRCVDAARELARAASRGESSDTLARVAEQLAPPGAAWTTRRDGRYVVARVTLGTELPEVLGGVDVLSATAVALQEPDWLSVVAGQDPR